MSQSTDPTTDPTPPLTIAALLAEFQTLSDKRDAKNAAHAATLDAAQKVIIAQATQTQAASTEAAAAADEDAVFEQLKSDLQAFHDATA